ncbi:MAG: DUF92 domain-containing protein [Anaerolineae bacterium]|nr:DUF92 domain-containing protein [Candidatus Roseilinea sp.]MDW8450476.1 DUF92 domain-containing protein [Anaerolineae bacterium]
MVESTATDAVLVRLALGLIISAGIGLLAYRRRSLARSGVWGAIITGTLIFGFGGWIAGLLLIAFFVSSSLLSHFKEDNARKQRAAEMFDKGGRRDLGQALANGGAAAGLAVLSWLARENPATAGALYAAMIGALATVNADTWATELGVLSQSPPRLITQPHKRVAPGTSGGITAMGTGAAMLGAAFIGLCYVVFTALYRFVAGFADAPDASPGFLAVIIAATIAGLAGSLFDSVLGATVQAMYYSEKRGKETEKRFERDGTPNRPIRGWPWLNNDWVNFLASLFGAAIMAGVWVMIND